MVVEALGDLLPDRAVAAAHVSFPTFVIQATDPRNGRVTIMTDILGGGGGARPGAPGDAAIDSYTSNCALLPAEIAELEFPWRIERTELAKARAAPVATRAGPACCATTPCSPTTATASTTSSRRPRFAARGRDGGGPGAPGAILLRRAGGSWRSLRRGKGTCTWAGGYGVVRRGGRWWLRSASPEPRKVT